MTRSPIQSWTLTRRAEQRHGLHGDPARASIIRELNPSMVLLKPGTAAYHLAELSNKMDFVHPDSAPAGLLNQIIWKSVKGVHSKMPAPRHDAAIEAKLHLAPARPPKRRDD